MRQSISARIFAGFLLVMLAFGGVIGYTVYRMHRVRERLELISSRYLRLALMLGEVDTVQGNLLTHIYFRQQGSPSAEDGAASGPRSPGTSKFLRRQVRLARQFRLHHVRRARRLIGRSADPELSPRDRQLSKRSREQLRALEQAFVRNEPMFDRLFSTDVRPQQVRKLGEELLRGERKLLGPIRRLSRALRAQVRKVAVEVEAAQRYGVWAGLALVLLALLVSAWVTFRARRRLSPLATLVERTKRIGSGDYAERVEVHSNDELGVLAREFNNMAAAVQEREQRLIRSERMAAAGRLASHITHEVRNPLNSISLNTELLEEELTAGEPLALCRAIRKEVDRLTDITEEYLRFARLPKPTLEQESINEILRDLLSFVGGELEEHNVECRLELAEGLPPLQADENQLRQAFLNLVRNAGEAMRGGGELTVRSSHDGEGWIEVTVADTGPGIDEQAIQQVFEPFFSTKDGGTGLGLALTQQIIGEHGGTIGVESEAGRGTTFAVRLPVTSAHDKMPPADPEREER